MAEKNILAYFKSSEDAHKALEKLKNSVGVVDIRIDEVSPFPVDGVEVLIDPTTGEFSSLAHLTLGADISNRNEGILLSSDVSASGMSGEGDDMLTRNYLLTAVVDHSGHDEALRIVEDLGGVI